MNLRYARLAARFHIPFVSTIILEVKGSVLYSGALPLKVLEKFYNEELFKAVEDVP
jgi:hypothetical protein